MIREIRGFAAGRDRWEEGNGLAHGPERLPSGSMAGCGQGRNAASRREQQESAAILRNSVMLCIHDLGNAMVAIAVEHAAESTKRAEAWHPRDPGYVFDEHVCGQDRFDQAAKLAEQYGLAVRVDPFLTLRTEGLTRRARGQEEFAVTSRRRRQCHGRGAEVTDIGQNEFGVIVTLVRRLTPRIPIKARDDFDACIQQPTSESASTAEEIVCNHRGPASLALPSTDDLATPSFEIAIRQPGTPGGL